MSHFQLLLKKKKKKKLLHCTNEMNVNNIYIKRDLNISQHVNDSTIGHECAHNIIYPLEWVKKEWLQKKYF